MDVKLNLEDKEQKKRVLEITKDLIIDKENLYKLREVFENELIRGLRGGLSESSLQMENTYVPELTNGKERGSYLALDLGGTNFRVMLLEMENGKIANELVSYYTLDDSTRLGPGTDLFDALAKCVMDFVTVHKLDETHDYLPLGFTFSFPMTQRGLGMISRFRLRWWSVIFTVRFYQI